MKLESRHQIASRHLYASTSFAMLLILSPCTASDLLDFTSTGSLSGWTTAGTVSTLNATDTLSLHGTPFHLTPASGEYMAKISPFGSSTACNSSTSCASIDAYLGLTSGTLSTLFNPLPAEYSKRATNFGIMTETVSLTAGTYTFYWSYAADDYHPYNDGVLFSIASPSVETVSILASNGSDANGGGGAQPSTVVVGDYGATQWTSYTLNVAASGSYQISFAAYNWGDTDDTLVPTLYIGANPGTVTGGSSSPIDTNASYYLFSNLGSTVTPDFQGGTLRLDTSGSTSSDFSVGAYAGNTIDAYGHIGIFSGVLSGDGGLTIADSAGGGSVVFTGPNTYGGGTTINAGATLQIGAGETTGSVVGDITDNGTLVFNRSDAVTYAGVISGSGRLTQAGSGTLILTGANAYTGGTTVSAGALQIGNGDTSGSIVGDITNNAAVAFNRSDAVTYAGVISGSGRLTQAGSGTLILTGANVYTGGTTVSAGTLQIGNGGTTGSITGNIIDNAAVAFNRSGSVVYGGVISGTGSASVSGGGTLILTGANTYSGGTSIAAGSTLQIGNGGTTGSIAGNVVNQGRLAFNRSDTVTFGGTITGSGTLVQNGTGSLVVTTNYTGSVVVNSGTVQIGSGSTAGTISGNITNNATVVYGQSASTTYNGVISGSGGVNVAGGGVVILNGSSTYTGPTTVTAGSLIIGDVTHTSAGIPGNATVSSGGLVGGYGTIGGNLIAAGGVVSPGNSIGTLTVSGNYAQSASSTLRIEVTPTAADRLVVGGTATLGGTLAVSLATGDYSTQSFAILKAGSVQGTFSSVTYSGADSKMVYGITYGTTEVDLAMTKATSGQIYGDITSQSLDTAVTLNRIAIEHVGGAKTNGWSVWSKTLAGASTTKGDTDLADYNSQLWGVISGVDYRMANGSALSGVFSYTRNQLGVHGQNDKAAVEGYFVALAGHMPVRRFAVEASAFLQYNEIAAIRGYGSTGRTDGRTNSLLGGGSLQVGYPVSGGDILPFARLTVASADTDAFSETGTLGLIVNATTRTSVRGSWGVQASHDFKTEAGIRITPHVLIGMENEFGERSRNTAMAFAGTGFVSPAPAPSDFSALVGAGVTANLNGKLAVTLETTGRISSNQKEGIAAFGIKYRF